MTLGAGEKPKFDLEGKHLCFTVYVEVNNITMAGVTVLWETSSIYWDLSINTLIHQEGSIMLH